MNEFSECSTGHVPYESPGIRRVEIAVEQGFAASESTIEDPLKNEDNGFWG